MKPNRSSTLGIAILTALTLATAVSADDRPRINSAAVTTLRRDLPRLPMLVRNGVHINSVRVEGAVGTPARFVVELQNNLRTTARLGGVFVDSNRSDSPYLEFNNLAPGERRQLVLNSTIPVGSVPTHQVGIIMEPDFALSGEVWDNVWHRLTFNGTGYTDTTFIR